MICDTVLDAIGHTPLVRLHRMVKPCLLVLRSVAA